MSTVPTQRVARHDVIVVGSGAAGMTAACVAAAEGRSVLLLEQSGLVGGTSAISGGMMWIPANHKMPAAGIDDDAEAARTYLSATAPRRNARLADVLIARGDEALRYLEERTSLKTRPVANYPDYYPAQPGSRPGGRVLEPLPFDGRALGEAFDRLRPPLPEFTLFGGMMISRDDIPHLRRIGRSLRSLVHVAGLVLAYGRQRLRAKRGTTLYLGNALAARLFRSVLDLGVDLRTDAQVVSLSMTEGRIDGLVARIDGRPTVFAADNVILATGGISHDRDLRARYTPLGAHRSATVARGDAPSGARIATAVGAHLSDPADGSAFWVPASFFKRGDGAAAVFPHTVTDRGKPGLIAVDRTGRRFVNEALSYHEFGLAQLRGGEDAMPAHLICDSAFIWKYGLGRIRPFSPSLRSAVASGYLAKADSIGGLASAIGVPVAVLEDTVRRYNVAAAAGDDPAFGRGGDRYQRHMGDAEVRPNPCVAPIVAPPFYAVEVHPADLGMAAGIVTNEHAQVVTADGSIVPGLFACGNDMHSVMGGAYPGPGITLGPAITFGYIAAMTACESARRLS